MFALAGCGPSVAAESGSPVQPGSGAGSDASPGNAFPRPTPSASSKQTPDACDLLQRNDLVAVATPFENSTTKITVDATPKEQRNPPVDKCFYNERGFFTESDGLHSG